MKIKNKITTILMIVIFIVLTTISTKVDEENISEEPIYNAHENSQQEIVIEKVKEIKEVEVIAEEVELVRQEYDLPLNNELLDYIWELCLEYEISYEMYLAIAGVESDYNINAIGVNKTSKDLGLTQLNSRYMYGHAKEVGIENFDPFNPYHNVHVAIYKLAKDREYWLGQGHSEEDAFDLVISSFNRGIQGTIKNGIASRYVNKVYQEKLRLERREE